MKILRISMPCLIRLTSLTIWEGAPLRSNLKLILHILDWIPSHIRPTRFGILYTPIWKRHLLFSILSNVYWNGLALFANVAAVFYATYTMFYSYILKNFTSFIEAFYWLLMNRHVCSTCVFNMYVSSHFHLYHTHRSFFIQSHNSLRLMLFVCSLCDSK